MKESFIENKLRVEVEKRGGLCQKWQSGWEGAPDRIVIWPGGIVHFVETKAPNKDLRELQKYRQKQLMDRGCVSLRIRTPEEVMTYVRSMTWNSPQEEAKYMPQKE